MATAGHGSFVLDSLLRALGGLGISREDLAGAVAGHEGDDPAAYLEAAAAHSDNPNLGLELGQRIAIPADSALAYLMMSSPTLGAALEHLERYVPTIVRRQAHLQLVH